MIVNDIDLLFCNEAELKLLYGTHELSEAVKKCSSDVELLACTIAEKGVIISHHGVIFSVPARKTTVLDTTGAGDLFASGFLYGLLKKESIEVCGRMGNFAASEIIKNLGARPHSHLTSLFINHFNS